jgi:hypothetical protein
MKYVLGILLMDLLGVQKNLSSTVWKYAEVVSSFVKEIRLVRSVDAL